MNINHLSQASGFRHSESSRLFNWAQAGESASIIGVSGVGKSNLFNHLCDLRTQMIYLGDEADNTIVIRVNFHYIPDYSDRSVYSLIMEQLELLEGDAERLDLSPQIFDDIVQYHEALLDAGDDVLKVQRYFKLALRPLLAKTRHRLVFLFDQFDELYREAAPHFFVNLRGLREAYKYRISYLIFTRDLLPNLTETDAAREEFYELMASNVMGIGPYNKADTANLLQRISQRTHLPLTDSLARRLYQLTRGHAGLLRATFLAVAQDSVELGDDDEETAALLLKTPAVTTECEKLWASLSLVERRTLAYHALGTFLDANGEQAIKPLQLKGLLTEEEPVTIFSPLFQAYIERQEPLWERPLHFDESARQVWVLGRPRPVLTPLEFRLFRELYRQKNEIALKDELIDAGWPTAKGGVSDEALVTAIARLRKKVEPDPKNPHFIKNVHNQGYTLQFEEPA